MKKLFKRHMKVFMLTVAVLVLTGTVFALGQIGGRSSSDPYEIGSYFQLGRYNDAPILWKCINNKDENGVLLLSDKVITTKAYDAKTNLEENSFRTATGFWPECTLRAWLNSTAQGGDVDWPRDNPPAVPYVADNAYADEDGFLSERNFSASELLAIKPVVQWQIVPENRPELTENGVQHFFISSYSIEHGWDPIIIGWGIEDFEYTYGAKYRLLDKVFLLDEMQLYQLWNNSGTVEASATEQAMEKSDGYFKYRGYYWLRWWGLEESGNAASAGNESSFVGEFANWGHLGVRPAFYLNTDAIVIRSGSGTESDPYIIDGVGPETNDITIFCNGKQMAFDDQPPVIESDRTLVPMRAIFEALGAEVTWDNTNRIVTAETADKKIVLQIDNNMMTVGYVDVELEVAPKIKNSRTLVPLRAVSEALDAHVEWLPESRQAVIFNVPDESAKHPKFLPEYDATDW